MNDFFEWSSATRTHGHPFKLYKRHCTYRSGLYFSQSVLLMYGTNCLSPLILLRYRQSCEVCMAWIYLAICFCKSSRPIFCLFVGQLLVHSVPCCPVFRQINMMNDIPCSLPFFFFFFFFFCELGVVKLIINYVTNRNKK